MDRRRFLSMLGAGVPASIVAGKVGLFDRATKYFFAPKQGWIQSSRSLYPGRLCTPTLFGGASGGGKTATGYFINNPSLEIGPDGLLSRGGQSEFSVYGRDGGLALYRQRYYFLEGKILTSYVLFGGTETLRRPFTTTHSERI